VKPEDMNTINDNGKAFNGNRRALIVAGISTAAFLLVTLIAALNAIPS